MQLAGVLCFHYVCGIAGDASKFAETIINDVDDRRGRERGDVRVEIWNTLGGDTSLL